VPKLSFPTSSQCAGFCTQPRRSLPHTSMYLGAWMNCRKYKIVGTESGFQRERNEEIHMTLICWIRVRAQTWKRNKIVLISNPHHSSPRHSSNNDQNIHCLNCHPSVRCFKHTFKVLLHGFCINSERTQESTNIDICKNVFLYFSLPVIHLRKMWTFRCTFVQTPIWVMIMRRHTNTRATRICTLACTFKLTCTTS